MKYIGLCAVCTGSGFPVLPDSGISWKYKAICRLHDAPVGQWSDVANIAVGV